VRLARYRSHHSQPLSCYLNAALPKEILENELKKRDQNLQKLTKSGELKEAAQNEAKLILREAQGRADLLLEKAQARLSEMDHDVNELKLRRRDAEGSLEASIQALYRASQAGVPVEMTSPG